MIQKIERELTTKYDEDKGHIEGLRNRIFNQTSFNTTNISKEEESDEELEPIDARDELLLYDRSQETYNLMMNEVKLFRKLEKDY